MIEFLGDEKEQSQPIRFGLEPLPASDAQAVEWLLKLVAAHREGRLAKISKSEFRQGWFAFAFLYNGLHPDGIHDHGTKTLRDAEISLPTSRLEPRLTNPYYERSGWPVLLAPIGKEAWRRFERGELSDSEYYCSEAQMAGVCHRSPNLAREVRHERTNGRN